MQSSPDHSSQLNAQPRDRFELISAYLDGEVTAAERKQVEEWLATDASVQQLHARLLKLRQSFRSLPTPPLSQPVEQTVDQVLARLDRRPNLRLIWGGGAAVAAMLIGAVTLMTPRTQIAKNPVAPQPPIEAQAAPETDGLMVALDRPVVTMSKATKPAPKSPAAVQHHNDTH